MSAEFLNKWHCRLFRSRNIERPTKRWSDRAQLNYFAIGN